MRTDISSDLKNKLMSNGATPIYYLIFHFASGDEYVSDRQMYTADGHLTNDLLSGVVNIRQSAALDEAVNNLLLPNTEIKITLKNTSSTGWFCSKINIDPIENTKVSLYLTSSDSVDELLIDEYLIRDPIEYSEDSPFVDLTLVTGILAQNVTIGAIDPATHEYYSLIVGAATETAGSPYGNQKFAKITAAINSATTVIPTDRDLITAGFPTSGDLSLGFGTCHYTGISSQSFTGVTGIDINLPVDSYICQLNNDITFAYGTGPVDIAEPLYVDGEIYENDYTVYKNENPVKVVFPDSLPYKIETSVLSYNHENSLSYSQFLNKNFYTSNYTGYSYESGYVATQYTKSSSAPWSKFLMFTKPIKLNYTIPSTATILSTNIYLKLKATSCSDFTYQYQGYTEVSGKLHGQTFYYKTPIPSSPNVLNYITLVKDLDNVTTSNTILNDYLENYFEIHMSGFGLNTSVIPEWEIQNCAFYEFSMAVTYEDNAPGYPKKIYTVTTSLNIGSSVGEVNPSTLIQSVIKQQSPDLKIDSTSFTNCYNWFDTNNYSFAGVVDGGMYCLDLLKQLLFMSRCYLTFAGGYAKLHISQSPDSAESKVISTGDTRLPKSIKIKRQPVDEVLNSITLRFDYNLTTELYDSVYSNSDQDSIDLLGVHESTIDGWLITNPDHAQSLTDYWLSGKSIPKTVFTIKETARMTGVEIGDAVFVKTDYSDIRFFTGTVIKLDKSPATKDNVTTYSLTLVGKLNPPPQVFDLYDDAIQVTEVRWIQLSGSYRSSTAIKTDGTLWAWGYNAYGQLGDGTTTERHSPVQIGTDNDWSKLATSTFHTMAIKADGTLWAWGRNNYGQLGDGTTTNRYSPVQIGTDNDWSKLAVGIYHTMALKTDGTLWVWGYNAYGQVGDGTTTNRYSPVQIGTDNDWSTVEGYYHSTMAIKTDGTLRAWGYNNHGQLGDGTTTNRYSPVQIGTDNDWSIAIVSYHAAAIKTDGTLWAWGYNEYGQVGDGTTTERHSPVQIGTDNDWSTVKLSFHTMAIKTDGTLWAWGYNEYGQVGDGTTTNRYSPVQIGYAPDEVAVGHYHTLISGKLHDLLSCGLNDRGQLGDGTTTDRHSPIIIHDLYRVLKEPVKLGDSSVDVTELMDSEASLGWTYAPWSILPWSDKAPTSGWGIDPWSTSGWSI